MVSSKIRNKNNNRNKRHAVSCQGTEITESAPKMIFGCPDCRKMIFGGVEWSGVGLDGWVGALFGGVA